MARPEYEIQKAVVSHIVTRGVSGLVYVHVPNTARRSPRTVQALRSMGMRKGASDLLLWHGGRAFALELKADDGVTSAEQLQFLTDMQKAGATVAVASGTRQALGYLEQWGLLRGVAA